MHLYTRSSYRFLSKSLDCSQTFLAISSADILSPEETKAGLEPESSELAGLLERLPDLPGLELRGLMMVPPFLEDLPAIRPYFRELRVLRDRLAAAHPRLSFDELSMGMSHDLETAIEEGSTCVRVGTAIFGAR